MYILAYDFGMGGIKASLYGADGACVWNDFSILDTISRADAETAPDLEAATDYARRYANWRLLTDKLGEWGKWMRRVVAPRIAEKSEI